jgi:hypothetical protein
MRTRKHHKSHNNRRRKTYKRSRRYHMKGGDRPAINILKDINLFSAKMSKLLDPLHGCAYVELEMIDNMYKLYKLPVDENILNPLETQHHKLINLIFHSIDGRIEPIHHLRDNTTLPIRKLAQYIILRFIWREYGRDVHQMTAEYVEKSKELKRITQQLEENPRLSATKKVAFAAKKSSLNDEVEVLVRLLLDKLDLLIADDDEDSDSDDDGVDKRVLPPLQKLMTDVENSYLKPLKQFIPLGEYTTTYSFHVLMALLWWKCPTKQHFKEFYEVANEYLQKFIPNEKIYIPDDFEHTEFTKADIARPIYTDPYKLFYCHYHIFKLNNSVDIKPIDFSKATIAGDEGNIIFTDCGETTIRNLIRIISYNHETELYDISILERLRAIPNIITYFRKYPTDKSQYTIGARNDWAELTARLEGIEYIKNDICEIRSHYGNTIKLLRIIFNGIADITDLNTEHIKIIHTSNPEHREMITNVLSNLAPEKRPYITFVIVIDDIPRFIWFDSGTHSHIESLFKKPEENMEVMTHYGRYAIRENPLLLYADSMAVNPIMLIHRLYTTSYNPYLLTDTNIIELITPDVDRVHGVAMLNIEEFDLEVLIQHQIHHGVHHTVPVPILNTADLSILMTLDIRPLKNLASYIINPKKQLKIYNLRYNSHYVMKHTDMLRRYTHYDHDDKILWINKPLYVDEMKTLINEDKLSPNLSALSFVSHYSLDDINQYIPMFPQLKALQINGMNTPLEGIEALYIDRYNQPYIKGDSLKTLIVREYFEGDWKNIPHSVETLIILYMSGNLPTVLPNLRRLQIVYSTKPIDRTHVPETVRILELGMDADRFIAKYPYFGTTSAVFKVSGDKLQVKYIPDNVRELYYYTFYIDAHIEYKRIVKGAFPSLDKLSVPMGFDDRDNPAKQPVHIKAFRHIDREELILENAILVNTPSPPSPPPR